MKWLLDRAPAGRPIRLGTIDAWLIHRLTGGRVHACDASNAARSQLLDLNRMEWSDELSALFGVPKAYLPEVRDSASRFGETLGVPGLRDGIPIAAAIGDSHAALFGHGAFEPGDGKVTFGTGSSIMTTLPHFIAPQTASPRRLPGRSAAPRPMPSKAISWFRPHRCHGWWRSSVYRTFRRWLISRAPRSRRGRASCRPLSVSAPPIGMPMHAPCFRGSRSTRHGADGTGRHRFHRLPGP